ncbi:MAG: hypothetical protein K8I30_19430, partial [Anaerolineae bacterium]|nr:hypothetical protein [Anaerolineae bacterium]
MANFRQPLSENDDENDGDESANLPLLSPNRFVAAAAITGDLCRLSSPRCARLSSSSWLSAHPQPYKRPFPMRLMCRSIAKSAAISANGLFLQIPHSTYTAYHQYATGWMKKVEHLGVHL